ncbi:thioredoxin-disulfide reductase [Candidatus Saccharibacteria bacterium]|nr:thioredoxin-disulfide reductase [Candidatus Saccharibacteria bacterium]
MKQYDVVIVGAGMAGLTSAIYSARANRKTLVLEGKAYGGQILTTMKIANYPGAPNVSGPELMERIYNQALGLGVEVKFEEVIEISNGEMKKVKTDEGEYEALAVILAVGAEDQEMEIPRERELVGHGVSYCATCDGAFYKDKAVAVVGGGNSALYETLYLADLASKIYLIHRRDEFRADAFLVDKVNGLSNVEMVLGFQPAEILGEERVEGLKLVPSGLVSGVDASREIEVDGIFVAIGKRPATKKYAELVKLNEKGYIVASEDCKTSCSGVFAAGDCRTKDIRQLITAAGDGAVAAKMAVEYLG